MDTNKVLRQLDSESPMREALPITDEEADTVEQLWEEFHASWEFVHKMERASSRRLDAWLEYRSYLLEKYVVNADEEEGDGDT